MTDFFHGIRIVESTTLTPSIATASSSLIGIVGIVGTTPKDFLPIKPYLVKNNDYFDGPIGDAVNAINLQTQARIVICGVKVESELIKAINSLQNIKQDLDLDLAFIVAPSVAKEHFADLSKIAMNTKSVLILDLPEKEKSGGYDDTLLDSIRSERVIACYPRVQIIRKTIPSKPEKPKDAKTDTPAKPSFNEVKAETQLDTVALSPYIAGVFARTDEEKGFWASPSNRKINGMYGLSTPIPYIEDNKDCLANELNSKKIMTVIRDDGFRVWGNSGLYDDNAPAYRFISVVRTKDVINRSLRRSLRWAIDRGITKNLLTEITAKVNEFLAQLKIKGAIIDGRVWADEAQNTPAALVDGKLFFNIEFTPIFIAEQITFTSILTDKYLTKLGS